MLASVLRARLAHAFVTITAAASLGACTDRPTEPRPVRAPAFASRDIAASAIVTVTNTNDIGPGSLRDAIATAPDGSTIQFDAGIAGGTIDLVSGKIGIEKSVTIEGPASAGMIITGDNAEIPQFVITNKSVTLVLRNLTVSDGGGIFSESNLTLDHVLLTRNVGYGGVRNSGTLTVINSTITGNTSLSVFVGMILSEGGSVTIRNSTIANNVGGGAISTISGASLTLDNSIIGTTADAALSDVCGLDHAPTLVGANLAGSAKCGTVGPNLIVADPRLGPLAANGGPTATLALAPDSPAIDAGSNCSVTTDQRYVSRPQGRACDIGAFEFTDFVNVQLSIDGGGTANSKTGVAVLSGTISCSAPASLTVHVSLDQPQKAKKVPVTESAAGDVAVSCDVSGVWAIALAPVTGGFESGSAAVTAAVLNAPKSVLASPASANVNLNWSHK